MEEQKRMEEINKRVAEAKKKAQAKKPEPVLACPIDPAERELCEGCQ